MYKYIHKHTCTFHTNHVYYQYMSHIKCNVHSFTTLTRALTLTEKDNMVAAAEYEFRRTQHNHRDEDWKLTLRTYAVITIQRMYQSWCMRRTMDSVFIYLFILRQR
jgi:hypothetical protein